VQTEPNHNSTAPRVLEQGRGVFAWLSCCYLGTSDPLNRMLFSEAETVVGKVGLSGSVLLLSHVWAEDVGHGRDLWQNEGL
jgi:hypothetical protein